MADERKDLPPVTAPFFLEKVREVCSTYLGNRGDPLNRGLTVRDLSDAGLIEIAAGYLSGRGRVPPVGGPGTRVEEAYVPDLTPPPTPSGFTATAAISNIMVECDAQTYTVGHGHSKSRLYGATWISGPLPVFADAVVLEEFQGTVFSHATNPATTWHLWLTWVTVDGVESTSPAGGTNGVVTRTGEDVALLLEALTGEITASQLHADLGSRIDIIDGGVVQPALAYPLAKLAALQDAANQQVRLDLDAMGVGLVDSLVTINNTLTTVHDAGIVVDPGSGTVVITGLEAANDHLTTVDARLDAAEGSIVLKASTVYVDNAIATAVLDPTAAPIFTALEARITTAELDISSLEGSVALKAATLDLDDTNVRMTDAEVAISSLEGTITTKVSQSEFDSVTGGLDARMGTAETTLAVVGDTSIIANEVFHSNQAVRIDDAQAVDLLRSILNNENLSNDTWLTIAAARQELTAYTDAGVAAEAAQRLLLVASIESNAAAISSEQIARANADSAIASDVTTLGVTVAGQTSAIENEQTARADADSALAIDITNLGVVVSGNTAAILSESNTRADADTALAGTITTLSSTVAGNTSAISTEATTRANADTAISGTVTTLSSTVSGHTTAIETEATTRAAETGELYAQYTVKLDVDGKVSGFGLASTGPTGTGSTFEIRADKFAISAPAGAAAGYVPFTVVTTPYTTADGVNIPVGVFAANAFILDGQITNAKIGNLAVDDAKISELSATKITAGSLQVGSYLRSTVYTPGSVGWAINADGTAEFSGVVVRGTIYASAGQIGGITIAAGALRTGQTAYDTGFGFYLGGDGTLSIGNSAGSKLTWDGSALGITSTQFTLNGGTATFSGDLAAATGSFAGSLSAASGTFAGTLTATAINAVDTINIAGNAVTTAAYASGNGFIRWWSGAGLSWDDTFSSLSFSAIAGDSVLIEAQWQTQTGIQSGYDASLAGTTRLLSSIVFNGSTVNSFTSTVTQVDADYLASATVYALRGVVTAPSTGSHTVSLNGVVSSSSGSGSYGFRNVTLSAFIRRR